MKTTVIGEFQIQTDGITVWVNSVSGAVARLGRQGIDVHSVDNTTCRDCGPIQDPTSVWPRFKESVLKVHGVTVPDEFRPTWTH